MLRLMHVHAHPDDESSKGAASTAKYVAEGVDVHVVTCTGGERGSILNPKMERPEVLANIERGPAPGDGCGPRDPRRTAGLAGLRGLGVAGGRPQAAAAGGVLRADGPAGRGRAAGAADQELPAARAHDVRRERRLPAPRPHPVPQRVGGCLRGGRRPVPVPGGRRALAAAEALLPPRFQPPAHPGAARRDGPARHGVAVRRTAGRVEGRPGARRPDHHQGPVCGVLPDPRPGAARPRHPDRPRRARGSAVRSTCTSRRGRPRTTSWRGRSSTPSCRRTTCSRGSAAGPTSTT